MPTKTPREKLEKYLADNWIVLHSREERIILSFIDTLLEEAKQEMKEKMKLRILPKKQREVYSYFEEYKNMHGNYPTYWQASKHFGVVSRQNIFIALRNARKKIDSIQSL